MESIIQRHDLVSPLSLRPGDRIGITAPASPFDRIAFFEGIRILEDFGFSVAYEESLFQEDGFLAGPDTHRLDGLHRLFEDQTIRAIWCARGGYGSLRLLPGIDFDILRENPKIFIGSSDISALLNTIHCRSGLITFHGPMVTTLARADETTITAVRQALTDTRPLSLQVDNPQVIQQGKARGMVLGGNLATVCHMLGTPYMPDFTGAIVFLEDIGEKPYRIDRMLTQMTLAGCFDRMAGILFGTFENCGDPAAIRQILSQCFGRSAVPVMAGFSIGHGMPNLTVPIGLEAILDSDSGTLTYLRGAVT